jgi:NitT/TauT family transport system permease protein
VVQIAASVPATALFPVFLLAWSVCRRPEPGRRAADADGHAVVSAVQHHRRGVGHPQDLKYTTALLQLSRWERWRTLILPACSPTSSPAPSPPAAGPGTPASSPSMSSSAARRCTRRDRCADRPGHRRGDYPLLLAATLAMVLTVVIVINRLVWRRLYRLAEERYRME